MGNHHHISSLAIEGRFIGWADDRYPHRRLKIHTDRGEQVMKIVKSLRLEIQDWQPGIWVSLWCKQRVNIVKGKTKIKIERLLDPSNRSFSQTTLDLSPPVHTIRVCQGSACRKQGSKGICEAIASYLEEHDLADRVQIRPVKCLHQCKTAPHVIFPPASVEGKIEGGISHQHGIHYPHFKTAQIAKIMGHHFPHLCASGVIGEDLLDRLSHLTYDFVY
jgi:hypothetical protein